MSSYLKWDMLVYGGGAAALWDYCREQDCRDQ